MIQTSTRAARRREQKNFARCWRYQNNSRWPIAQRKVRIFQYFGQAYWITEQ